MSPTLSIIEEKITPSRAAELLEGNSINRSLRMGVVQRYARDMTAGQWHQSGDPIRLDKKGTLLDGQHRLSAIIHAGIAQKMLIIKGVETKAILTIDTGAKRQFADVLKIQGYSCCMNLAAVVRWCVLYEDPLRTPTKDSASHGEMMRWLDANLGAPEAVRNVCATSNNPILKRIRLPLCVLRHYAKNKSDYDLFQARLAAGTGLEEGDSIHTLRRYIENLSVATPPTPLVLHGIVVKAWNAYMRGDTVRLLYFRPGGSAPEQFPEIITET